ncbi:PREDICTED: cytochrome P450 6k1-like [Polistes canadensis]|uniref:cytochrome P450 6k1-like n=1 Tax=Polistes canadensis TaxID=91411 RepID=UPI000718F2DC|nr:PREDICTED: cytochrome P450 6k1-like [Polistes canadensis]
MTYMDMVVSETLRMYPPLGFLDRVAINDYKVPDSDLLIEKGTPIMISMIGMHYDEQYFPNSKKFDPERFNNVNKKNRPGYVYFPFGEGPHICIGARIGLLQAKLGILHLLKQHEYSPSEHTTIPMRLNPKGVTATPINGIQLNVRKYI